MECSDESLTLADCCDIIDLGNRVSTFDSDRDYELIPYLCYFHLLHRVYASP